MLRLFICLFIALFASVCSEEFELSVVHSNDTSDEERASIIDMSLVEQERQKYSCLRSETVAVVGTNQKYCLPSGIDLTQMCGNLNLKTNGECPHEGAKPWSNRTDLILTVNATCQHDPTTNLYVCSIVPLQEQQPVTISYPISLDPKLTVVEQPIVQNSTENESTEIKNITIPQKNTSKSQVSTDPNPVAVQPPSVSNSKENKSEVPPNKLTRSQASCDSFSYGLVTLAIVMFFFM